jgi:hypothetical protein
MLRRVVYQNPDPNANKPFVFDYFVSEDNDESWGEGISVYHNPNARIPLPKVFFPSASQHSMVNECYLMENAEVHIFSSFTMIISRAENSS